MAALAAGWALLRIAVIAGGIHAYGIPNTIPTLWRLPAGLLTLAFAEVIRHGNRLRAQQDGAT